MRRLKVLVLCLWAVPGFGQSIDTTTLSTVLAAHGGLAVDAVQTIQLTGTLDAGGKRQPVVIAAAIDGRIRIDLGAPVERSVVTTDAGRFDINNGKVMARQPHVGLFSALDLLSVLGIRRYMDPTAQVTLLGTSTLGARTTVRLKAATDARKTFYRRDLADEVEMDIDSATALLARVRRVQYAERSLDRPFWLAYDFSDYRSVNGVMFPFRIGSSIDGRTTSTLIVDAVAINPALSPAVWEVK